MWGGGGLCTMGGLQWMFNILKIDKDYVYRSTLDYGSQRTKPSHMV